MNSHAHHHGPISAPAGSRFSRITGTGLAAVFLSLGLAPVGHAQTLTAQGIAESLRACQAISDDTRRLACFDALATDRLSAPQAKAEAPGTPAKGEADTLKAERDALAAERRALEARKKAEKADREKARREQFGKDEPEPDRVQAITATIKKVRTLRTGMLAILLDNGQIWLQSGTASPGPVDAGETVTIKEGAFGGHMMRFETSGRAIRVDRRS
ncbi:hypothetical protein [Yunchengibacter salinarum]|uniref:hypothetical protein n=1 Tax=Yunchengibacter salinarum TaxID=3133399 RepID=UPI0035B59F56